MARSLLKTWSIVASSSSSRNGNDSGSESSVQRNFPQRSAPPVAASTASAASSASTPRILNEPCARSASVLAVHGSVNSSPEPRASPALDEGNPRVIRPGGSAAPGSRSPIATPSGGSSTNPTAAKSSSSGRSSRAGAATPVDAAPVIAIGTAVHRENPAYVVAAGNDPGHPPAPSRGNLLPTATRIALEYPGSTPTPEVDMQGVPSPVDGYDSGARRNGAAAAGSETIAMRKNNGGIAVPIAPVRSAASRKPLPTPTAAGGPARSFAAAASPQYDPRYHESQQQTSHSSQRRVSEEQRSPMTAGGPADQVSGHDNQYRSFTNIAGAAGQQLHPPPGMGSADPRPDVSMHLRAQTVDGRFSSASAGCVGAGAAAPYPMRTPTRNRMGDYPGPATSLAVPEQDGARCDAQELVRQNFALQQRLSQLQARNEMLTVERDRLVEQFSVVEDAHREEIGVLRHQLSEFHQQVIHLEGRLAARDDAAVSEFDFNITKVIERHSTLRTRVTTGGFWRNVIKTLQAECNNDAARMEKLLHYIRSSCDRYLDDRGFLPLDDRPTTLARFLGALCFSHVWTIIERDAWMIHLTGMYRICGSHAVSKASLFRSLSEFVETSGVPLRIAASLNERWDRGFAWQLPLQAILPVIIEMLKLKMAVQILDEQLVLFVSPEGTDAVELMEQDRIDEALDVYIKEHGIQQNLSRQPASMAIPAGPGPASDHSRMLGSGGGSFGVATGRANVVFCSACPGISQNGNVLERECVVATKRIGQQ